ncbi:MAG TPA: PEP-CTERM sorting domain-containing protein [Rhizomicrobium sp.]|jgi:hypothetical protein
MKFATTLAAGFIAATASLIASPASADFIFLFDENGTGCVANADHVCTTPSPGVLEADPTGRVAGNVLVYTLPDAVGEGDVGIGEFGTGILSDVLTFTDPNGGLDGLGSLMIFYSALGGGEKADSGFPDQEFNIVANENANGSFTYSPGSNIYIGESPETVGVPEPITLSLFGAGLAGAVALRRRKKK